MKKINCLIVEDEPLAVEVLQDYINQVPFLNLKGICSDAIFALDFLKKEEIDLIFLDIHLPKLKGLDFLKMLKKPPQIILTTAYHQYAIESYEYNILDYLLKPIEFSRFLMAVNKIEPKEKLEFFEKTIEPKTERDFLFFSVEKKKVKVFFDEILYIESLKEYIRIVTKTKKLITHSQIGQIEKLFDESKFLRIHRSFIVSKDKIEAFSSTEIEVSGIILPIGRNYKELIMKQLEK